MPHSAPLPKPSPGLVPNLLTFLDEPAKQGQLNAGDHAPASQQKELLEEACRLMIKAIGENPEREGLLSTPSRFAETILFFTKGYEQSIEGTQQTSLQAF